MNKLKKLSLRVIFPLIFFVTFIISQGSVFFLEYRQNQDKLYVKAEQHIKGVAGHLQMGLSSILMGSEKADAQTLVSTVALNKNIKSIAVIDNNQQVILSTKFQDKFKPAKGNIEGYDEALLPKVTNQNKFIFNFLENNQELIAYAPLQIASKDNSFNRNFNAVIFIRYSLKQSY